MPYIETLDLPAFMPDLVDDFVERLRAYFSGRRDS